MTEAKAIFMLIGSTFGFMIITHSILSFILMDAKKDEKEINTWLIEKIIRRN